MLPNKNWYFSLGNDANVKSILFKEGTAELKPRVKSCLDKNGTLVVVLFGWDNPPQEDEQYLKKFREKLHSIDTHYDDAKIEIWPQNKLIGFLKPFPSLALQVNKRDDARFQTHQSWARTAEMQREFVARDSQLRRISDIREKLRGIGEKTEAIHVRIYGDPGIGKTRLVLEATRKEDLLPLVVYCDSASKFKDSDLM